MGVRHRPARLRSASCKARRSGHAASLLEPGEKRSDRIAHGPGLLDPGEVARARHDYHLRSGYQPGGLRRRPDRDNAPLAVAVRGSRRAWWLRVIPERLTERELKMMSRLARAQARRMEHEHSAPDQAPLAEAFAMAG